MEIRNLSQNKHRTQKNYRNSSFTYKSNPQPHLPSSGSSWAKIVQDSSNPVEKLLSPNECYDMFKQFTTSVLACKTIQQQIDTIARLSLSFTQKYYGHK